MNRASIAPTRRAWRLVGGALVSFVDDDFRRVTTLSAIARQLEHPVEHVRGVEHDGHADLEARNVCRIVGHLHSECAPFPSIDCCPYVFLGAGAGGEPMLDEQHLSRLQAGHEPLLDQGQLGHCALMSTGHGLPRGVGHMHLVLRPEQLTCYMVEPDSGVARKARSAPDPDHRRRALPPPPPPPPAPPPHPPPPPGHALLARPPPLPP